MSGCPGYEPVGAWMGLAGARSLRRADGCDDRLVAGAPAEPGRRMSDEHDHFFTASIIRTVVAASSRPSDSAASRAAMTLAYSRGSTLVKRVAA